MPDIKAVVDSSIIGVKKEMLLTLIVTQCSIYLLDFIAMNDVLVVSSIVNAKFLVE